MAKRSDEKFLALREKSEEQKVTLIRFLGDLTKRDIEMLLLIGREMARIAADASAAEKSTQTRHTQAGWLARKRDGASQWDRLAFQHLESDGLVAFGEQPFVTLFGNELVEALA